MQTDDFVKNLESAVSSLDFFEPYPENSGTTFQEALDHYVAYYQRLSSSEEKEALSGVFWAQIAILGTPIIEDDLASDDRPSDVYFLFPKDDLLASEERQDTKKDLYLQGDYHGYDTTEGQRQQVTELADTGIMLHKDIMPRDAIVVYRYIQLEPSLKSRTPTQHHGSSVIEACPESFFPDEAQKEPENILPQTENASYAFLGKESRLEDRYSRHRLQYNAPDITARTFRVSSVVKRAYLPVRSVDWSRLLSEETSGDSERKFVFHKSLYSDRANVLHGSEAPISGDYAVQLFSAEPTYSEFTRAIHVFRPVLSEGRIEDVVVVNDGVQCLGTGIMDHFEEMATQGTLSPHTALVFVTGLPGMAHLIPEGDLTAAMPGMAERVVDCKHGIDQYAKFIEQLFREEILGVALPHEPRHRVMIGSSLGGTAVIYIACKHPTLFGGVIAQSASPSNREILRDVVVQKDQPRAHIDLSCGRFEEPDYAANTNLPYAKELAGKLDIPLHIGNHGHEFIAWHKDLERSLPNIIEKMQSRHQDDSSSSSSSTASRKRSASNMARGGGAQASSSPEEGGGAGYKSPSDMKR